jgi:predicted Fe-Mo cluster-binding NifX family protein
MRYALPVHEGFLSQHFGQSQEFMLVDVENGRIKDKKVISTTPHGCHTLPELLAGQGVSVVLVGGIGMAPRMAFQRNNIEVVVGVTEADPEKAVLNHARGTLVSGLNTCEHGDSPCDGSGHGHH